MATSDKKPSWMSAQKAFFKETAVFLLDILYNAAIIIALVVLIRSFLISPFRVIGSSMADTLKSNEFILINKLSYRLSEPDRGDPIVFRPPITGKYPHKFEDVFRTDENGVATLDLSPLITTKKVVYCQNKLLSRFWFCMDDVNEGDMLYLRALTGGRPTEISWDDAEKHIITAQEADSEKLIFNVTPGTSYMFRIYDAAGPEYFVKRIIGIPGDIVKIENGRVYLKTTPEADFEEVAEAYLNEENKNNTYFPYPTGTNVFTVPEEHYFVLGDNRNHSNDSRSWFSPIDQVFTPYVSRDYLSGKVLLVLWPLQSIRFIGSP